eukprot:scaffold7210_cov421-Prasinococcus_capsulatus_cf.AAC.2
MHMRQGATAGRARASYAAHGSYQGHVFPVEEDVRATIGCCACGACGVVPINVGARITKGYGTAA